MRTDPKVLPTECGVYLFRSSSGKVLYVGKAINIRTRVRSHIQDKRSEKEKKLVEASDSVDWIATRSELEALILEDTLIKRYKPRFNVRLKDDKSYPYLIITSESFPAVRQIRGLHPDQGEHFGPHSDPRAVRRSLRWLRKIFPVRSCRRDMTKRSRPCLEYHLGRCLAPCKGEVKEEDYALAVEGIRQFLSGRSEKITSKLEKEMWKASSEENFERAAMIRDILRGLKKIRQGQKVFLVKGGDVDVISIREEDEGASVVKVRGGRVVDVLSFSLIGEKEAFDPSRDFISSLYAISGYIPPKIILRPMTMTSDKRDELQSFLSAKRGTKTRIVRPRGKDARALIDMADRNTNLFLSRKERELEIDQVLLQVKEALSLEEVPSIVEGFDISHLAGTGTVAAMVQFRNAKPHKSGYRRFKIRTASNDDYAAMKEAVHRRYKRVIDQGDEMPGLILIDGGKGQMNAATDALEELGVKRGPEMLAIAKREEELFKPGMDLSIILDKNDNALRFLQRVRDEAHRFAVSYQRKLRKNDLGYLKEVPGIGDARARKVLLSFGDLEEIVKAGPEKVAENCSIPHHVAERLIIHIRSEVGRWSQGTN